MAEGTRTADHLRQLVAQNGLTQAAIASAVRASQPQVSRVLAGKTSMASKLARDIWMYVNALSRATPRDRVATSEVLMDALAETWDGTPQHAKALAAVIRSLSLLTSQSDV